MVGRCRHEVASVPIARHFKSQHTSCVIGINRVISMISNIINIIISIIISIIVILIICIIINRVVSIIINIIDNGSNAKKYL